MKSVKAVVVGAALVSLVLGLAGPVLAADPPNWVALLYVEAQKMVGLRWTPVPGATGYKVLRSATAGAGYAEIATSPTPQYFDKDLEPGTTYYYVLQSVDAGGPSRNSLERSVAIPGQKKVEAVKPPEWDKIVPQTAVEFGKATAKVGLFWKASKGSIAAYNVLRSQTPGSGYEMIGSTAETQYVDAAVQVGKTYYYVLTALDAATFAETPYSAEQKAEIKEPEKRVTKKEERIIQKFRIGRILKNIKEGEWGILNGASDIDVDWDGKVIFVVCAADASIYRFDFNGEFLSKFGQGEPANLSRPVGLDWDAYGELLYVADNLTSRVVIFNGEGKFRGEIKVTTEHGTADPKYIPVPSDVCVSPDGERIVIIDNQRAKALVYDAKGKFLQDLSKDVPFRSGELASFTFPTRCVFNTNKGYEADLLVSDTFGGRIQIYNFDSEKWRAFGEMGEVAGQFKTVLSAAVDRNNHIWTADKDNFVVSEFDYDGKYISILGQKEPNATGNNVLLMGTPAAIAVDPNKDHAWVLNMYGGILHEVEWTQEIITGK